MKKMIFLVATLTLTFATVSSANAVKIGGNTPSCIDERTPNIWYCY